MKKALLFLTLNVVFKLTTAQTIPNSGFENWSGGEPDSWSTNNSASPSLVTQSSQSHTGSSAAKLGTFDVGAGFFSGSLGTGFDFSGALPPAIRFWAKGNLAPSNELYLTVGFSGSASAATGNAEIASLNPNLYTQYYATINTVVGSQFDTAVVAIFMGEDDLGPAVSSLNNEAFIDDITFGAAQGTTGTIEQVISNNFNLSVVYNDYANGNIIFELSLQKFSSISLDVYDIYGKKVKNLLNSSIGAGNYRVEDNIESLNAGVYFCVLTTQEGVKTAKFVK